MRFFITQLMCWKYSHFVHRMSLDSDPVLHRQRNLSFDLIFLPGIGWEGIWDLILVDGLFRIKARISTVLPRPISSAKIPPVGKSTFGGSISENSPVTAFQKKNSVGDDFRVNMSNAAGMESGILSRWIMKETASLWYSLSKGRRDLCWTSSVPGIRRGNCSRVFRNRS